MIIAEHPSSIIYASTSSLLDYAAFSVAPTRDQCRNAHPEMANGLCESAQEARSLAAKAEYSQAALAYSEALNLGRKAVVSLQEVEPQKLETPDLPEKSLDWLIQVFCDSCSLRLDHLNDADGARSDAWAACVFSQYQSTQALECMQRVCRHSKDAIGELQAITQLLQCTESSKIPHHVGQRNDWSSRLAELEHILEEKYLAD